MKSTFSYFYILSVWYDFKIQFFSPRKILNTDQQELSMQKSRKENSDTSFLSGFLEY